MKNTGELVKEQEERQAYVEDLLKRLEALSSLPIKEPRKRLLRFGRWYCPECNSRLDINSFKLHLDGYGYNWLKCLKCNYEFAERFTNYNV